MTTNIIIAGVGGQGVITAGMLISEAAMMKGINTVMSEIHGLAQRGGSVSVDIRMNDVYSAIVASGDADIIIGFEPIESVRASRRAGKQTKIIINTEKLPPISLGLKGEEYPDVRNLISDLGQTFEVYPVDALSLAKRAGNYRAVNVVMVGAALSVGAIPLSKEDILKAISSIFPERLRAVNEKALEYGMEAIPRLRSIKH